MVWKGRLDRQSCWGGCPGQSPWWPFSLWVPRARNPCLHVVHACSSYRIMLPFSNEIICFYFPCHKDEVSSYFMANLLNSKPLAVCVQPRWVCVWRPQPASNSVCWLKNRGHSVAQAVLLSKLIADPSLQSWPGVDHIGPWKPPRQDGFIFQKVLFAGQKKRHRRREQTYGHQGGRLAGGRWLWWNELGDWD